MARPTLCEAKSDCSTWEDSPEDEAGGICAGCEQMFPEDELSEAETRQGTVTLCPTCLEDFLAGRGG